MKKQILGLFAIIMLSATAISATKSNTIITTNGNYSIRDTTPHKMYPKKHHDSTYHNRMDTSMHHYRDTTHRDSTHK